MEQAFYDLMASDYGQIIVFDMIIAVITAKIAQNKGHSPIKWFVFGVVLNFFALVWILFTTKKQNEFC